MNEYRIEDLSPGMRESFTVAVTEDMMEKFLDITKDENPLHTDGSFAKKHGFKDRVVYGMLTASLISAFGGCYLPGKFCLIQGVEIKFAKPVFVHDELTVAGYVSKVDRDLRYLEIKVTIYNQYGEKVVRGLLKAGVMNA